MDVAITTGATYDRTTGSKSGGTTTTATIRSSPPFPYDVGWTPGDVVQDADVVLILAAVALEAEGIEPAPGMTVETDGRAYVALRVRRFASGEQDAAWLLVAKDGTGPSPSPSAGS